MTILRIEPFIICSLRHSGYLLTSLLAFPAISKPGFGAIVRMICALHNSGLNQVELSEEGRKWYGKDGRGRAFSTLGMFRKNAHRFNNGTSPWGVNFQNRMGGLSVLKF